MAKYISETDFGKVINFFGGMNVRRAANGGTSIIVSPVNNVMNDTRDNTICYALYRYEDGFRWRRIILGMFNEMKPYQLFRHGINFNYNKWGRYPTDYVFESFATVEEALARFTKYINHLNMAA